jgi:uncharacterized Zn finger protein
MKITLQAKSSGDTPYAVDFLVEDGKLTVHCNCKAGIFGQLCKHKTELLAGDTSRLYDPEQAHELQRIQDILAGCSDLQDAAAEVAAAEKVVREKQREVKALKKRFAALLADGISISEEAT